MSFPLIPCLTMLALASGIVVTLAGLGLVEHQQRSAAQALMALLPDQSSSFSLSLIGKTHSEGETG